MYYDKARTDKQLNERISDAADICGDLFEFINKLIVAVEEKDHIETKKLIIEWEGDK